MIWLNQGRFYFEINKSLQDKRAQYALYQIDNKSGAVLKRYWYQEDPIFQLELMGHNIKDIRFRIYIIENGNKIIKNYYSEEIHTSDRGLNAKEFVEWIASKQDQNILSIYLYSALEDPMFFAYFIGVKHGSKKINLDNLNFINKYLLDYLLQDEGDESLTFKKNSLKFLIYFLDINVLLTHKETIFQKCDFYFSIKDLLFFKGVFYFRIGKREEAKTYNSFLYRYKHDLDYYQQGAISYVNVSKNELLSEQSEGQISPLQFAVRIEELSKKSILLMSCDYGYFCAYSAETIENAAKSGNLLHFHLVIPSLEVLKNVDLDFLKKNNIGLSYELCHLDSVRAKTYYSISRYLVMKEISEEYDKNIIICDIDINLKDCVDYISESLGNSKIGLISNGGDLPWITYMAGFNYFGKNTFNLEFVAILTSTLRRLFYSGRDLWTLDQVAILLSVELFDKKNIEIIENLKIHLKHSVKQYPNRQSYRKVAEESLKDIGSL